MSNRARKVSGETSRRFVLRMFFPDARCTRLDGICLRVMGLLWLSSFAKTSSDFSGYMSKVLRNYTEHACDGEYISLRCPHRTTISIQSSFYGRKAPSHQMCPSRYPQTFTELEVEDLSCSAITSLQKMLDECQDRRSCQLLVNSRIFGTDPCPGTSKYLVVWYKCRPNEYKSKVACEDDKLRLNCKRSMVIAIYSTIFGRSQEGSLECPYKNIGVPAIECRSTLALQILAKRCHGKRTCSVYASSYEFGDPCYPGVRKFLNVIYTCVPKKLLDETNPKPTHYQGFHHPNLPLHPRAHDPNIIRDGVFSHDVLPFITETSLPEEKKKGRSPSSYPMDTKPLPPPVDETDVRLLDRTMETRGIQTEMELLSNILAAYSYITVRISCRTELRKPAAKHPAEEDSDEDDSDDDNSDATSDLSARRHRRFERTLNMNVFTSAEELERAQRLEERERIIREIWMNGQPDIPATRSLNRYY
ncbi:protein eva-1 homolog C isoform X2 [Callorhinchus milii]|uniref:protein eva-1 homolog C isoform X2 n=1 Tax=Callorhinchus milii TaxID=7868 RepID=UPI00045727C4|nr:protein eva-1 homolog C isoform X2 [Callorhinchus milii]|eukprot:gi/632970173/ref/XP_007901499.1/ PREDICTED: protein eva-1 homolog A isoform X2 [Callorhinchus milii]